MRRATRRSSFADRAYQFYISLNPPKVPRAVTVMNPYYYDDRKLERAVTPFIISSVEHHIAFGCRRDHVVILGRGTNARFFARLNDEHRWFEHVHPLDHPRFIMQYRRKRLDEYLDLYSSLLSGISVGSPGW